MFWILWLRLDFGLYRGLSRFLCFWLDFGILVGTFAILTTLATFYTFATLRHSQKGFSALESIRLWIWLRVLSMILAQCFCVRRDFSLGIMV